MDTVTVRICNSYSDGHESTVDVEVEAPASVDELDDWWQDVVFEHTGDGHGDGGLGSCYEATIIAGPNELLGKNEEWID